MNENKHENEVCADIQSNVGFYIGDPGWAVRMKYIDHWRGTHKIDNGRVEDPDTGMSFAVIKLNRRVFRLVDTNGEIRGLDADNIGLVPLEMVDTFSGRSFLGTVIRELGVATFDATDDMVRIETPSGRVIEFDLKKQEV